MPQQQLNNLDLRGIRHLDIVHARRERPRKKFKPRRRNRHNHRAASQLLLEIGRPRPALQVHQVPVSEGAGTLEIVYDGKKVDLQRCHLRHRPERQLLLEVGRLRAALQVRQVPAKAQRVRTGWAVNCVFKIFLTVRHCHRHDHQSARQLPLVGGRPGEAFQVHQISAKHATAGIRR